MSDRPGILLDDVPVSADGAGTIGDVLGEVRRRALPHGRLITGVTIDGINVSGAALDEAMNRLAVGIRELVIHSEEGVSLVLCTLRAAQSTLPEIQSLRERIADLLISGELEQGTRLIGELVRSWSNTVTAVDGCAELLGVPGASMPETSGPPVVDLPMPIRAAAGNVLATALPLVRQALGELHQALSTGDQVRLADHLRYELGEVLERWQDVITSMMQAAQSACD